MVVTVAVVVVVVVIVVVVVVVVSKVNISFIGMFFLQKLLKLQVLNWNIYITNI